MNKNKTLKDFLDLKEEALAWVYKDTPNLGQDLKNLLEGIPDHFHPWPDFIIDLDFSGIKTCSFNSIVLSAPEWKTASKDQIFIVAEIRKVKGFFSDTYKFEYSSNCKGDYPPVIKKVLESFENFLLEESSYLLGKLSTNFTKLKNEYGRKEFGLAFKESFCF